MAWKMLRGVVATAVVLLVLLAICNGQGNAKTKRRSAVKKSMPPSKMSKVSAGLSSPLGSVLQMICDRPLPPKFGNMSCSSNARRMVCTGMCSKGWKFPSKKPNVKIQCSNYDGTWTPSNKFPDCEPECNPACENGGRCLGNGKCSCTKGFRGKRCQHPISNCDINSVEAFVNIRCNHTNSITRCQLSCPPGTDFEIAPPDDVTCSLDGKWTPAVIPSCKPINLVIHEEKSTMSSAILKEAQPDIHSGICTTWKQEHFRTFDGRIFNVKGTCTYLLLKDCNFNTFAIHLEMDPLCEEGNKCRPVIHIFMDNTKFTMRQTDNGPKVIWEGHEMAIPASYGALTIELVTYYIIIRVPRMFYMLWDGQDSFSVNVENEVAEKTCGLCGRKDGNMTNDFTTVDGSVTKDEVSFFNSWKMDRLGAFCPDAYEPESSCRYDSPEEKEISEKAIRFCSRLRSPEYAICTSVINPEPYIEACKLEYCSCGLSSENCGCSSLETFFRECLALGITIPGNWRKADFCPMKCPHGMIYDDCGSPCPRTCKTGLQKCEYDYCMDGCHCPPGTVRHGDSCLAADDCPCQFQGNEYATGSRIQQDCNSCICYGGKWECSKEQCEARCTTVGDPHYTTFDGRRYDFMGKCSYYLLKGEDYSIEHENVACTGAISKELGLHVSASSDFPSCTKSVTIQIEGSVVHLKQGHEVILNGREVKDFPFAAPGVYVHMASSMFMKVELSNSITVWWDGVTRVYIDVPPSFIKRTKGLCGTFSLNQYDDFLTSEDDIEQDVNAFANKWKTFQVCSDLPVGKGLRDPCDIYAQRKEQAKSLCGIINTKVFSSCHELVEPEPFYKDCLYDMCSCQNEIKSCLCPSIADYGAACAKKGLLIDWRSTVKECAIRCTGGQKYHVCGSSCKRSCMDIANNPNCKEKCVEGCNCPEGMTLNMINECIPISSCPCLFDDKEYAAGESEVRGRDYCMCSNGAWECRPASEDEILAQEAKNLELKATICPTEKNMEYTDCESSCMPTCGKVQSNALCSNEECKPGCKCKEGYVFDPKTTQCVRPSECHCHHAGKIYSEAEVIQEECNTCVCHSGSWNCQTKVCPGLCSTWGGSHFKTFDGKMFEFRGDCEYTLVRANGDSGFVVDIQLSACGTTDFACLDGIAITIGKDQMFLQREKEIERIVTSQFIVRSVGLFVVVHTHVGLTIHWDRGSRVYLRVDTKWRDRLEGLCGNYNGNGLDDFQTPRGGISVVRATAFADSWKVYDYCPKSEKANDNCEHHGNRKSWAVRKCGVMKTDLFAACHGEVSYEPYMERCIADTCACEMGGDCECLCTAIAAYAQECSLHGIPIKWRSQELCPIQCKTCDQYVPCMSVCPPLTCDTQFTYAELQKSCGLEMCVEGCQPPPCSPDQIYSDDFNFTCIPREECHRPPCKIINGQMYHEGERVADPELVDPCQTCHCINGELSCDGKPCGVTPIISTTTPVPVTEAPPVCKEGWTDWMNAYTPTLKNGGDYESFSELRKNGYSFCHLTDMTAIECRTIGTHSIYKETGQVVSCELPDGLVCENINQDGVKLCLDYEIRVECECEEARSLPFSTPTTAGLLPVTVLPKNPIICNDGWTVWMNGHSPDANGEFELINDLRDDNDFCSDNEIINVQCRDVASKEPSSQSVMEGLECTLDRGFVCMGQTCPDYETRFFCQCSESRCDAERGMKSNSIKDYQITASSFISTDHLPYNARLDNDRAWTSQFSTDDQWIQVDLEDIEEITGIKTQGNPREPNWVTQYKVDYSVDGVTWKTVQRVAGQGEVFEGNSNSNDTTRNAFEAVEARFIRVIPLDWVGRISLRLELLGCNRKEEPVGTTLLPVALPTGTPFPAICDRTGWTDWMNIDSPDNVQRQEEIDGNPGDHELIEDLRQFYSFCPNPTSIECRVAHSTMKSHLTGQEVHCDPEHGLRCINSKQSDGKCLDYEIRLYCECEATTIPPTTTIPTTIPEVTPECPTNNQGFTDWMNSNNPKKSNDGDLETYDNLRRRYSFCDQRFITHIQCRVAGTDIPYNEADQNGIVCDLNLGLQCLHSLQPSRRCKDYEIRFFCTCLDVTAATLPTTTYATETPAVKNFTTIPPPPVTEIEIPQICDDWTSWISLDQPFDEYESELTAELFDKRTCPKIVTIRCRDVITKQPYNKFDLELDVPCNTKGIVCDESRNGGQICPDFEISVFCTCPTTAPPTTPTPKPEYPCVQGWTEWFNTDDPSSGEGDLETIENLRKEYDFCAPEEIIKVECAVRKGGKKNENLKTKGEKGKPKPERIIDYHDTGDFAVKCNKEKGLICYNEQQSRRKCKDYSIRFYCQCGPRTTITPTTKLIPTTLPPEKTTELTTTLQPRECGWTEWINSYHPIPQDIADGDYETIESLTEKYGICSLPDLRGLECRITNSKIPVETAGQIGVSCDIINGLRCENRLQLSGCHDYEVRVYCMYDWCNETTISPIVTTTTFQPTTTPPCSPGEVWDDCAYSCDQMCQSFLITSIDRGECDSDKGKICVPGCMKTSCEPPQVWRDEYTCVDLMSCPCIIKENGTFVAPSTVVETSECERCQCQNNTLICSTIPRCREETPKPRVILPTTTPFPVPRDIETNTCWTEWVNIDTPETKMGDNEDLMEIRQRYTFCSNPIKIECRIAGSNISYYDGGQNVECNLFSGLNCWNTMNGKEGCYDYEVRFYCPCVTSTSPVYTMPPRKTTAAITSTVVETSTSPSYSLPPRTRTTAPPYTSTTIETTTLPSIPFRPRTSPRRPICIQGYTEWFNVHVPDNVGESETVAEIRAKKTVFCTNEHITGIECRTKITKRPYDQSDSRGAVCNIREGFHCRNEDQLPGEVCEDFEVRFLCDCGYISPGVTRTTPGIQIQTKPPVVTEIPPVPPCTEFIYTLAHLPESNIQASSSRSPLYGPKSALLDSKPGPDHGGAWIPASLSPDEYLLIDLGAIQPVYGIITQGHADADEWVKTYNLYYSNDGQDFTLYKTFLGNQDHTHKSKHIFETPFEARYIKIQPLSWQGQISMRLEILSCASLTSSRAPPTTTTIIPTTAPPCEDPMGLENGQLSDSQISASSSRNDFHGPSRVRLNTTESPEGSGGWMAKTLDKDQYIQIDFLEPRILTGVVTQGRDGHEQWVTGFFVSFSNNGHDWNTISDANGPEYFVGNYDSETPAVSLFPQSVRAQYLRIYPQAWNNWISLRLEVLGCFEALPTTAGVLNKTETSPPPIVCQDHMGLENGEISDNMITVSSSKYGPESDGTRVRLHTKKDAREKGGWVPEVDDGEQFVTIDLKQPRNLTGIILQGRDDEDEWVTDYTVVGWDGHDWIDLENSEGNPVFRGNIDSSTPKTETFKEMVELSMIRIVPAEWHNWPSLRLELLGCFHPEITTEAITEITTELMTTAVPEVTTTAAPEVCDDVMGLENGDISDDMISVSSSKDGRNSDGSRIRLNTKEDIGTGGWVPETADQEQYIIIDFKEPRNITGLILQGRDESNEWVTKFTVAVWDGQDWIDLEDDEGNTLFSGNTDSSTPIKSKFKNLVETPMIQIRPVEWHDWPSMRLEVIGCYHPYPTAVCEEPMGLEDQFLLDAQISVSTSLAGDQSGSKRVRLNTLEENDTGGWVAGKADMNQFVQIDFWHPVNITGVVTQGRNKHKEWVTRYRVISSIDGTVWKDVRDTTGGEIFIGNSDENTAVKRLFQNSIMARYIRIRPVSWNKWIAMRVEVLGCREITSTTPPVPSEATSTTPPVKSTTMIPSSTFMTTTEECLEYGPWINTHYPTQSNEGDEEPIDEVIRQSMICEYPIDIECREAINQQDYSKSGQNVICDLEHGLRCRHADQKQLNCYDYEVRIVCYTCAVNETTSPPPPIPTCPEIPQESAYKCPTTCAPGTLCDGENCVHIVDCPCYQDGKKFVPGEKVLNPECLECSCWMGGHSHCVDRVCPPCEEGEKPVDHRNCSCECEPCPDGTILCPTSKVCIPEDKWCDGVLDCLDDEKYCTTTPVPTTPCPPPVLVTCPADTLLILKDPAAVCPEYTCVPVPTTPTTLPPPGVADCNVNSNHFKTFDDLEYQYDICDNVLLQDKVESKFNVSLHKNCIPGTTHCTKSVVINQDSHRFVLGGDLSVAVNDLQYTASQLVKIGKNQNEFNVKIVGDTVIFKSQKYGFHVEWDIRMNLKIGVSDDLLFRVNGMCGFYSKSPDDEKEKPNGEQATDIEDFGDSWLLGPKTCEPEICEPAAMEEAIATCNELRLPPFDVCHEIAPVDNHVEVCKSQMCECLLNTNKTEKECRCQSYLNYAGACELKDTEWRIKHGCVPKCPPGLEWHDCASDCERTCDNIHEDLEDMECDPDACISGCFCPPGLVKKGEKCIEKEKCQDCICKGFGDPHYYSFDNQYFPFQGNCTYILARDQVPEGEDHKFEVYATNEDCSEEPNTTCTVAVMVLYNGHIAHFRINESVTFDGVQMYYDDFPFEAYGINITSHAGRSITFVVEEVHLEVRYFELNYGFEVKVPSEIYFNKTEGLCGVCNYDKSDDKMHKDGYVTNNTNDFAFSWVATPPEQFQSENEICKVKHETEIICTRPNDCDILIGPLFQQCHSIVEPEPYLMACRFDVCHSEKPNDSLCRGLMEYARACAREGICLNNWRSDSLCPYECPAGMYFDQCGSACMKTCRTKDRYHNIKEECPLDVIDGCFCIGDRVLKDGECVDPIMCDVCDKEHHKIGDEWKPNPCKTCTCDMDLTVECTTIECPLKPTCKVDESLRVTPADNLTCCDKYECVPLPPPACPDVDRPHCLPGETLVTKKTSDNCPFYECECDPDKCPKVVFPPNMEVGEVVTFNNTGCCTLLDITCKIEECPPKPVCEKFTVLKKKDSSKSKCCEEYYCEPLKDVCIYTHTMKSDEPISLDEADKYRKSYRHDEKWNDGPCTSCVCLGTLGTYQAECVTTVCPEVRMMNEEYVLDKEQVPGECCSIIHPIMCVVGGENVTIGETVPSPDGDKCKKVYCEQTDKGHANKVEIISRCTTDCRADEEYVQSPADSPECCGSCQKVACSDPDMPSEIHQVGDTWPSPNNPCEHRECVNMTNVGITLIEQTQLCPPLPTDCLPENIYKDDKGCCDLCKELPPKDCKPELFEGDTTEYFEIFQKGSICTNKKPIEGFMECKGRCESYSFYKAESRAFESTCKCCSPAETEEKALQLDCTDGSTVPFLYEQPKTCKCTECSGLQEDNFKPIPPPNEK